ncbi:hypothetical protein BaRGS_00011744 [Batillaria attramentaria]|uniref:Uncharacterized protein n=1 Tax=Batillaria attramentaria TaxID=370345 RepID=A0ABD0LCH9_9CAEN
MLSSDFSVVWAHNKILPHGVADVCSLFFRTKMSMFRNLGRCSCKIGLDKNAWSAGARCENLGRRPKHRPPHGVAEVSSACAAKCACARVLFLLCCSVGLCVGEVR